MTESAGTVSHLGIESDKMSDFIPRGIIMEQDAHSLLTYARQFFPQEVVAQKLGVTPRTLRRWESGEVAMRSSIIPALREIVGAFGAQSKAGNDNGFDFIDLFAGIGGIRMGFEAHRGRCVFTSEWNKYAAQTYKANFDDGHEINGDITKVNENDIPDHDVLLAGFPCQPFSIAGVSKKNSLGRAHGFMCDTQGTLFFDVARIIQAKQPAAFMLENVKNLTSHDKGRTFEVIKRTLSEDLGYHIHFKVIDGRSFVPQHRERIIIVGFRAPVPFSWDALQLAKEGPRLGSILHPQDGSEQAEEPYTTGAKAKVNSKYILTDKLWAYLQNYAAKHKAKGNGFGFGLVTKKDVARTLSARYYKDGSEILVSRGGKRNPRRLTPRECARLMGFPDTYQIPVSDTQAYKQFGNSVVMPVMKEVARIMTPHVLSIKSGEDVRAQIDLL